VIFPLIDTHVHIDELVAVEGIVRRAQSAGIRGVIGVGCDLVSSKRILQTAQAYLALRYSDNLSPYFAGGH
jgi:Tat protein secretion system quality control protein TatD with DNase activity